jgi:hypothetical protein
MMEKYRAIPPGFMTVGAVAGKLSPSAESEGGRRTGGNT